MAETGHPQWVFSLPVDPASPGPRSEELRVLGSSIPKHLGIPKRSLVSCITSLLDFLRTLGRDEGCGKGWESTILIVYVSQIACATFVNNLFQMNHLTWLVILVNQ